MCNRYHSYFKELLQTMKRHCYLSCFRVRTRG